MKEATLTWYGHMIRRNEELDGDIMDRNEEIRRCAKVDIAEEDEGSNAEMEWTVKWIGAERK
jgi:hypothetical protein